MNVPGEQLFFISTKEIRDIEELENSQRYVWIKPCLTKRYGHNFWRRRKVFGRSFTRSLRV